jgi:hypothetical protein
VQGDAVPRTLRERLGPEGTAGLLHALDLAEREWRNDVLSLAGERFERRLAEVGSSLRVQIAQSEAAVRADMAQLEARLRHEMAQLEVRLRHELSQVEVRIFSGILRQIADARGDLVEWSFLFWIGQVVAMSAIMAAMLRLIR